MDDMDLARIKRLSFNAWEITTLFGQILQVKMLKALLFIILENSY